MAAARSPSVTPPTSRPPAWTTTPPTLVTQTRVYGTDRSFQITFASGQVETYRPDATLAQRTLPSGEVDTFEADGIRLTRVDRGADGHDVYTYAPDGTSTISYQDATDVEVRREGRSAGGDLLWTRLPQVDGTATVTYADSHVDTLRADETLASRLLANGDLETYDVTGLQLERIDHADGSSEAWTRALDGSYEQAFFSATAALVRTEFHRDNGDPGSCGIPRWPDRLVRLHGFVEGGDRFPRRSQRPLRTRRDAWWARTGPMPPRPSTRGAPMAPTRPSSMTQTGSRSSVGAMMSRARSSGRAKKQRTARRS